MWNEWNYTESTEIKKFCQRDIDFVGFHISWERFMPSNDMMASVKCFPMPTQPTIADIRAWFGLIIQLAPFLISTGIMKPFCELLKSKSKLVYWDDVLQSSFEYAKVAICKLIETGLSCYNKGKKTAVITDWSHNGMGFLLVQQDCQCIPDTPFCCENTVGADVSHLQKRKKNVLVEFSVAKDQNYEGVV